MDLTSNMVPYTALKENWEKFLERYKGLKA